MKYLGQYSAALTVIGVLAFGDLARAQEAAPASPSEAVAIEDLVVTARRTDAPIWEVVRGDSTLIMVGSIGGVPRDLDWRPEALEEATRRADHILMPQYGSASLADVGRIIWRMRTIGNLPRGTTSADYLSPELQVRLERVMANERRDSWRTRSFTLLGMDLMTDHAGYRNRRTRSAAEVVKAAASKLGKPAVAVGTVRGSEIVDSLINLPPETFVPCIERAVDAAEAGPEAAAQRIEDWRNRRVVQVMAQPLTKALDHCWPWGDPELAPQLRGQWSAAAIEALGRPGVTLAVAQLTVLAEPGGVLDQLQAAGYEIEGPDWKPSQVRP